MWITRRVCFVLVFFGFVVSLWLKPAPMSAQTPLTGDRAAPLLNPEQAGSKHDFEAGLNSINGGTSYATASYPGIAFHRRNSNVGYAYYGAGCTYIKSIPGATVGDNEALSTKLAIPEGATIIGVEFQYRDTDAATNSQLYIQRFNGIGGMQSIALLSSSGNGGYGSSYTAASFTPTPYDSYSYAYSLVWYSGGVGINHALCGVRVKYAYTPSVARPVSTPPANRPDALQGGISGYNFTAASDFVAVDASSRYSYAGAGCMILTEGLNLSTEVDMPDGMQFRGYRAFYYNTSGQTMYANLVHVNGSSTSAVAIETTTQATGYANDYIDLDNNVQIINEVLKGYLLYIRPGNSESAKMCGIRSFYSLPVQGRSTATAASKPIAKVVGDRDAKGALLSEAANEPSPIQTLELGTVEASASPNITDEYQFLTPYSFVPRDTAYVQQIDAAGCVSFDTDSEITYTFQLPAKSAIRGIRFYYRNLAGNGATARLWAYDGRGWFNPIFAYQIPTTTGYASQIVDYTGSHYDLSEGSIHHSISFSLLNPTNTVQFCGARIWYTTALRHFYIPVAFK